MKRKILLLFTILALSSMANENLELLNEISPSKNAKIPDVCEELNVRCISMNQFFEEIGLSI